MPHFTTFLSTSERWILLRISSIINVAAHRMNISIVFSIFADEKCSPKFRTLSYFSRDYFAFRFIKLMIWWVKYEQSHIPLSCCHSKIFWRMRKINDSYLYQEISTSLACLFWAAFCHVTNSAVCRFEIIIALGMTNVLKISRKKIWRTRNKNHSSKSMFW